jgi:hypothetical protein
MISASKYKEMIFSNLRLETRVYTKFAMITELRVVNIATSKLLLPRVQCSHIPTFINSFGHLRRGHATKSIIFSYVGDNIQINLMSYH